MSAPGCPAAPDFSQALAKLKARFETRIRELVTDYGTQVSELFQQQLLDQNRENEWLRTQLHARQRQQQQAISSPDIVRRGDRRFRVHFAPMVELAHECRTQSQESLQPSAEEVGMDRQSQPARLPGGGGGGGGSSSLHGIEVIALDTAEELGSETDHDPDLDMPALERPATGSAAACVSPQPPADANQRKRKTPSPSSVADVALSGRLASQAKPNLPPASKRRRGAGLTFRGDLEEGAPPLSQFQPQQPQNRESRPLPPPTLDTQDHLMLLLSEEEEEQQQEKIMEEQQRSLASLSYKTTLLAGRPSIDDPRNGVAPPPRQPSTPSRAPEVLTVASSLELPSYSSPPIVLLSDSAPLSPPRESDSTQPPENGASSASSSASSRPPAAVASSRGVTEAVGARRLPVEARPDFEVVRNRELREQMTAISCIQCAHWYKAIAGCMTAAQAERMCQHAGRHRFWKPPAATPEDYWDITSPQTPVDSQPNPTPSREANGDQPRQQSQQVSPVGDSGSQSASADAVMVESPVFIDMELAEDEEQLTADHQLEPPPTPPGSSTSLLRQEESTLQGSLVYE